MEVTIVVTRMCHHRHILERQLQALGVSYQVRFVEGCPDLVTAYGLRSSPNLLVDHALAFRAAEERLPTGAQLRDFLRLGEARRDAESRPIERRVLM